MLSILLFSALFRLKKQTTERTICYRYDSQPPEHCSKLLTCGSEPLQLDKRITRSTLHHVVFNGWVDPVPRWGASRTASKIESYEIRVNEVMPSKGRIKVDYTKNVIPSTKVMKTVKSMILNLTSNAPRLYCITLEVKDVADNVRQCRRFVLFDNTSSIKIWNEHPFRFTSASPGTNYTWQTHHNDVCLSWKDYFYNNFYIHNELLNPIEPDPHGLITGSYDQITGEIPVSGTSNVYGIIAYYVSWRLNHGSFSEEKPIRSFTNQLFCKNLNVKDGNTYTVNVKAIDIAGNTLSDSRTLFIDRSGPHLNNIWLEKDGYEMLFVHNSTDLSDMKMTFDAFDPHSGLSKIYWTFGIADTMTELLSEHLGVRTTNNSCSSTLCYCPDIGDCAFFSNTVPLNKLQLYAKNMGHHNRNYYFTVKVTNMAGLSATEHIDVLVDDSPPSEGVVYEGPEDYPDVDYTSDDSIIVHWHGFIDHESGIRLYRVGLSERCLSTQDLYNFTEVPSILIFREVPFSEASVRIPTNFIGKRFVTVIALNNAMEPSKPACSDGVIRDISPPGLRNITFEYGSSSESLLCLHGEVYLMQTNIKTAKLHNTSECRRICAEDVETNTVTDIYQIHKIKGENEKVSSFLCEHLPLYTNDTFIYLPNDNIFITWDIQEGESQIDDFFIGLGFNPTEKECPTIVAYQSTQRKPYFKRRHEGIGSDELFYIFVKILNKAGLENIATVGPILIDQTPPLNRTLPQVTMDNEHIVFGWNSNTFYDDEQTAQIDQIYFQIAHNGLAATPYLEWRLDTSTPCPLYSGGCFRYPLRRLQLHDTYNNLEFYMNMHVYNNAGHYLSVTSQSFQLPSRYPPRQTVILDIDPSVNSSFVDVDAHLTKKVLCGRWIEFVHNGNLVLEVGVGLSNTTDDVVNFQIVINSNTYCLHSSDIRTNVRYFFLLKSSRNGVFSISYSDGVIVLDNDDIIKSLSVSIGYDTVSPVANTYDVILSNNSVRVKVNESLHVGKRYIINIPYKADVTSDDGIVTTVGIETFIRPFVNKPAFAIHVENSTNVHDHLSIQVSLRPVPNVLFHSKRLVDSWKFVDHHLGFLYKSVGLAYSVGISETNSITGQNKTYVVPFQSRIDSNHFVLEEHNFLPYKEYIAEVRVCSKLECIDPIQSNEFFIERQNSVLQITEASVFVGYTCVRLTLHWLIEDKDIGMAFHQWTLAQDAEGRNTLISWKYIANNSTEIKVEDCVVLPVHGHCSLYACVKAYSVSGQSMGSCKKLTKMNFGTYDANVVYDFDTVSESWTQIKSIFQSSDVGEKITFLHNNEFDFGTRILSPAAAVLHAYERNVTFYLMTSRRVPNDCDTEVACLQEKVTSDGFVVFDESNVFLHTTFYCCAFSNKTLVEREWFNETFEEIRYCSDGFIFDNTAPIPVGQINVQNSNGYITDIEHVVITWDPFHEETGATLIGYPEDIQHYSIGVGKNPNRGDIISFHNTGRETAAMLSLTGIVDGTSVYFTVNGSDYFGLSSVLVSTEFVTDTSPPIIGKIHFDQHHVFLSSDTISIRLVDFNDDHSGISYFNVGIGSTDNMVDKISMTKYYSDSINIDVHESNILDGHAYFICVQAINRADIPSAIVSKRFILDRTPPDSGHVFDGNWESKIDIDYQSDIYTIHANWKEFIDMESDIDYFKVGLGTEHFATDVRTFIDVGLKQG